jgi:outer membrane protein assembly factor BamB
MRFKTPFQILRAVLVAAACAALLPADTSAQKSSGSKRPQKGGAAKPAAPAQGQKAAAPVARQVDSSVRIRWRGQPGVERYRLQVARDEGFNDIIHDQAVTGREVLVTLPSGQYFWRVAPAVGETGTYTTPQAVELSATSTTTEERVVVSPSGGGGWRTATGEMPYVVPARLRAGTGLDLVGVTTAGTTFGIDGTNGVALWTARYNASARRGDAAPPKVSMFAPLVMAGADGRSNVVVAFDGGVRALRGETGREMWRAAVPGTVTAGAVGPGDGREEIHLLTSDPSALVVLRGDTGAVVSNTSLPARTVGAPAPISGAGGSGVLIGYEDGTVELRRAGGEPLRSEKLGATLTTGPIAIPTTRDLIVAVGTEKGLSALRASDLKHLGRIETGGDTPAGRLVVADIDGDRNAEVLMTTRGGRVALIGTSDGRIRWVAEGAKGADSAALADLNGDGVLDVITAAEGLFANGFSGTDGALIWRVEEMTGGSRAAQSTSTSAPRTMAVALTNMDSVFLVGGDPVGTGLRAVELPKGALRTAER